MQIHSQQLKAITAVPANDFLNSIGVNTSINSRTEKVDTTLKTCQYMGVRWIRSAPPAGSTSFNDLKKLYQVGGIRFSFTLSPNGEAQNDIYGTTHPNGIAYLISNAKDLIKRLSPDALIGFEGPNEPNNWEITYQGEKSGHGYSWRNLARYQRDMYVAVKADPVLKDYPVWSFSSTGAAPENFGVQYLEVPENATEVDAEFRGAIFADYANCHNYFCGWAAHSNNQTWMASDPSQNARGDHLYGNFGKTWAKGFTGHTVTELRTIPRVTTETGIPLTLPEDLEYNDPAKRVTEEDQGLYFLSCYLAQFKQGWKYTAMYILRDRADEGGNQTFGFYAQERREGAINISSIPRLGAHYMHNFTTILADNQSIQSPGAVNYGISNIPVSNIGGKGYPLVHDLLLQKNDGRMMLVIWGEKYQYGATPDDVTVQFGETYGQVKVYSPAQYDAADPEKGIQPVATCNQVNEVTLSMLNRPYILEFTPAGTAINEPAAEQNAVSVYAYDDVLTVKSAMPLKQIAVYDLAGKIVFQQANLNTGITDLNTGFLPQGCYIIKTTSAKDKVETRKIIKL
jgi:hypothetical protein